MNRLGVKPDGVTVCDKCGHDYISCSVPHSAMSCLEKQVLILHAELAAARAACHRLEADLASAALIIGSQDASIKALKPEVPE